MAEQPDPEDPYGAAMLLWLWLPVTGTLLATVLVLGAAAEFWGVIVAAGGVTVLTSVVASLVVARRRLSTARSAVVGAVVALISVAALMPAVGLGNLALEAIGAFGWSDPDPVWETVRTSLGQAVFAVLLVGWFAALVGAGTAVAARAVAVRCGVRGRRRPVASE